MKKIITVIISIGLSQSMYCQDDKFEIGFNIYPNFSNGLIVDNGTAPNSIASFIGNNEVWKPSISGNIFVEYLINEKMSLSIGFGYQNNGEKTRKSATYHGVKLDPDMPDSFRSIRNHHNLEIPLAYKYYLKNKIYATVGSSLTYNISNTSTSIHYYNDKKKNERNTSEDNSTEFQILNGTINLGIGIEQYVGRKSALILQPYAQYGIMGIAVDVPINRRMFSAGLLIGLKI